jgi:putative ABC transport system permease protein
MLMSMREQTTDVGILKSLGFTDGSVFGLFMAQGMFLCLVGGGVGLLVAWSTQGMIARSIEFMFPGYSITPRSFALAALVSIVLGVLAGWIPAARARRLHCVEALRGTE